MSLKVEQAIAFMKEAHAGQLRKDGSPYEGHPLGVRDIALNECPWDPDEDEETGIILHDIVEDTDHTIDELLGLFGMRTAGYVYQMTKDPLPEIGRYKRYQAKLMLSDPAVKSGKLCDMMHNLRSCHLISDDYPSKEDGTLKAMNIKRCRTFGTELALSLNKYRGNWSAVRLWWDITLKTELSKFGINT